MLQLFFPFCVFLERYQTTLKKKKLHLCPPAVYGYGIIIKGISCFFQMFR